MKIVGLSLIMGVILILGASTVYAQSSDKMPGPGEPHLLSRTATTLKFTWAPPLTDNRYPITGYSIQRREDMGNWRGVCRAVTTNICEVTNLPPSGNQTFRVRASNTIGRGNWSQEVTFGTLPRAGSAQLCLSDDHVICLYNNRFEVSVDWRVEESDGRGNVRISNDTSGEFNLDAFNHAEVLRVELYDNCQASDFFTFRILTILDSKTDWTLRVTDSRTGMSKEYFSPPQKMQGMLTDLEAFATCDE